MPVKLIVVRSHCRKIHSLGMRSISHVCRYLKNDRTLRSCRKRVDDIKVDCTDTIFVQRRVNCRTSSITHNHTRVDFVRIIANISHPKNRRYTLLCIPCRPRNIISRCYSRCDIPSTTIVKVPQRRTVGRMKNMIRPMQQKTRTCLCIVVIRLVRPVCHTQCRIRIIISLMFNSSSRF